MPRTTIASRRTPERIPEAPSEPTLSPPYERIKQCILSGEIPPGHPLVEVALAKWCKVSRTPIREALTRLEQDGLVYRENSGLVVCHRSPEEILDLYDTRIVLEGAAARVASERRTEHDVTLLRWSAMRGREIPSDDIDGLVEANQQFHRMIWRATHNESLVDLLERLDLHLGRYPSTTLSFPGRWGEAIEQHDQLVEEIRRRNGDKAEDVARRHFEAARDIRLELFARERFT